MWGIKFGKWVHYSDNKVMYKRIKIKGRWSPFVRVFRKDRLRQLGLRKKGYCAAMTKKGPCILPAKKPHRVHVGIREERD